MGVDLDKVPLSGIIRIRDMMYSVANPFRLDQGDVSFEAPGRTIVVSIFTGNHFGSGEMLENAIGLVAKDVADYFAYRH